MKIINAVIVFIGSLLLFSNLAWSHARLKTPAPRNNNAGIKIGPCGGIARTNTPTVVQGGQLLTVSWEETINHPGKFILSLSMANDANFNANQLAQVIDTKNATNDLPHQYSTQVSIPDIDCATCTIQMIQSMEENPAAPTYYYSCADIQIVKSTTVTTVPATTGGTGGSSGNVNTQQITEKSPSFGGAGCGLVDSGNGPKSSGGLMIVLLAFTSVVTLIAYRKSRKV